LPWDIRIPCKIMSYVLSTLPSNEFALGSTAQATLVLLNRSMKCENSAFNAQGSKIIIGVVQVGAVYVASVEARSGERKHKMKLSLFPKSAGKISLGLSYFVW
jgi:hypothetical protein